MPQHAILSLGANFGMVMPGLAPGIFFDARRCGEKISKDAS
jgi:hypothetical protein